MHALLTVIATWLSITFALPAIQDHPTVVFASSAQMSAMQHARLAATGQHRVGAQSLPFALRGGGEGVFAMYDDATRTIFLHENWTGTSPASISLLVHEMVHHLQHAAGMTFACAGEREKVAYLAQREWLRLFDRSLEKEFGLDPMTILLRTNCLH